MTDQPKASDSDSTKKKEENSQANGPADSDNPPPTPRVIISLGGYLVLVTLIVVFGIYSLWPGCKPSQAAPAAPPGKQESQERKDILLTPQSGPIEGKTPIRIIGSDFADGVTTVSFGTESLSKPDMTVESATLIVAMAPAHVPGKVDVILTKKPGAAADVLSYWYLPAPLSVTTVTPNSGIVEGGTPVNIIGTGFVEGTQPIEKAKVSFGGTLSESVAVASATSIVATLPAHPAGKVDIVVTNGDGQVIMKGDAFTYKCPGLSEFATLLMIVCAGALGGCLHAMRSLVDYVGARQLKRSWVLYYILLPFTSAMIALVFYLIIRAGFYSPESSTADTAAIMVGLAVLVGLFSEAAMEKLKKIAVALLTEPPPRPDKIDKAPSLDLQRLLPVKGSTEGGDSVTVEGRGFADTAEVTFDGLKATIVSRAGDTSITVTTPAHAAETVDVEVRNPDDTTSKLSGSFTYEAPVEQPPGVDPEEPAPSPTITGVNPKLGPISGGTTVTIEGTGFDAKGVQFDGVDATVVDATAASVSVTTPPHDPGPVKIVVTNKDGKTIKLESGFTYE